MAALTTASLARATRVLARRDPDLARVIAMHGVPPLWAREPGFAALILIILEQQVSLASARTAFNRLAQACGTVTPAAILQFDDATFKLIGFSRQKAGYARGLAQRILAGAFDPDGLERMSDMQARVALIALKGVGAWTADIYLLMALRRPDVWPQGDLALVKAAGRVKGLAPRPTPETWEALGEPWRPYRSVAARVLWTEYLSKT
ncbi:MAG: DNA-3-methyladenine glycosylase 2 family protein [Thermoflexales bacterium]